jgi:AbrB family looped-hinge helix DNA binding protein
MGAVVISRMSGARRRWGPGGQGASPSQQLKPQNKLGSIGITYDDFAMDVTTVSPKFQVVIPKRVREQFGLSPGQTLQVIALPGRIALVPTQSPAALRGFLPGKNTFQREGDRL